MTQVTTGSVARDLVLLHGGLYDSSSWDLVVRHLEREAVGAFRSIVVLDFPGSGRKRGSPNVDSSRSEIIDELNADVRAAGAQHAVLVGHSVAATLVVEMVLRQRYEALCIITGPVLEPGQPAAELFGNSTFGSEPHKVGYPADPETTDPMAMHRLRFTLDMTDADADAWLADVGKNVVPSSIMSTPFPGIDTARLPPVTYVVADRSPVFPVDWQERFAH